MHSERRPRFFQFSISALLLIAVCAAIGGYIGRERAREIRYHDWDTGEERVCHSRLEVVRAINKKIREFTAAMADLEERERAHERLMKLITVVNFVANDEEFAVATGPSSPNADKYEWPGPHKYAYRYVAETNGTFQLGLGINWPDKPGGEFVLNALIKSSSKTATSHSESESMLSFPLENAKWFTMEREPEKLIALSALKGAAAGFACWLIVRLAMWLRRKRGTSPEAERMAQEVQQV